jgi:hypothetical protein
MRGEVGPSLLQRVRISVDADELERARRVEKTARVPGATECSVDEDSPILQTREECFGDLFCEYRFVNHVLFVLESIVLATQSSGCDRDHAEQSADRRPREREDDDSLRHLSS